MSALADCGCADSASIGSCPGGPCRGRGRRSSGRSGRRFRGRVAARQCSSASGSIGSTFTAPDKDRRRSFSNPVSAAPRSIGSGFSPRSRGSPGRAATIARATAGASAVPEPRHADRIAGKSWTGFSCTRTFRLPTCWSVTPSAVSPSDCSPRASEGADGGGARPRRRDPRAPVPADGIGRGASRRWHRQGGDSSSRTTGWCRAPCPNSLKPLAQRLALARKAIRTLYGELGSLRHSARQVGAIRRAPEAPVIVLARGPRRDADDRHHGLDGTWLDLQRELAETMKNGSFQVVSGSGHYIHLDRPERVVDAIRTIVD